MIGGSKRKRDHGLRDDGEDVQVFGCIQPPPFGTPSQRMLDKKTALANYDSNDYKAGYPSSFYDTADVASRPLKVGSGDSSMLEYATTMFAATAPNKPPFPPDGELCHRGRAWHLAWTQMLSNDQCQVHLELLFSSPARDRHFLCLRLCFPEGARSSVVCPRFTLLDLHLTALSALRSRFLTHSPPSPRSFPSSSSDR